MLIPRRRRGPSEAAWADLVSDAGKKNISERTLRRARTELELDIGYTGRGKPAWGLPMLERLKWSVSQITS